MAKSTRAIIADDSSFIRTSLKRILEKNEIEVVGEAENGLDVITRYRELKPDLVVMDIIMPQMTGQDALKLLRQIDSNACVIMISSMSTKDSVSECLAAGAKNYLLKPFDEKKVIEAIKKALADLMDRILLP